jgi:hypothetical protein
MQTLPLTHATIFSLRAEATGTATDEHVRCNSFYRMEVDPAQV